MEPKSDNGYQYHQEYDLEVEKAETAWIAERRRACRQDQACETEVGPMAGLALSGGGIRSASFCLGMLQALHRYGHLKYFDFLSSVSGGGYTASALTWYMSNLGRFPFGVKRDDFDDTGGRVLGWLRGHAKFLTPGSGITLSALVAAVIAAIFTNLLILIPLLLLLIAVPEYTKFSEPVVIYNLVCDGGFGYFGNLSVWMDAAFLRRDDRQLTLYGVSFLAAFFFFLLFFALIIVQACYSAVRRARGFLWQRRMRRLMGRLLWFSILLGGISSLPIAHQIIQTLEADRLAHWMQLMGFSGTGLVGILMTLLGTKVGKAGDDTRGVRALLFRTGLVVTIAGLLLLLYHVIGHSGMQLDPRDTLFFWFWLALSLVLALIANINIVSMHYFYRNRLLEAFMPNIDIPQKDGRKPDPDKCHLSDIKPHCGPYHIINTTLCTVGSDNPVLYERGGENFIFSPEYCGSYNTAYRRTGHYCNDQLDLATAFAISGAAVSPNNYFTRSRPLSIMMTLFNLRLSYWIRNPKRERLPYLQPMWYWYMLRELLGFGLNEKTEYVLLSDGGHFENLGVYELIRRRCKFILAIDAGRDPQWQFQDLARLVELVRVDFGAAIDFDGADFTGQGFANPDCPWYLGTIRYTTDKKTNEDDKDKTQAAEEGVILYIKSGLFSGLPADIVGYHKANPGFPDESTANQFFSEQQFEAYRELGYLHGQRIAKPDGKEHCTPQEKFWEPLRKAIVLPQEN